MNGKKLLAGIVTIIFGLSVAGLFSANADTERATTDSTYTTADIQNLQNFLLERETPDLSGKDYDLNGDGVWNVLDLSLMKQQYQPQTSGKTLVAYYSASGTTERIAEYLAEEMNADVFVITPVNEYTSADLNWTDSNSRVVQEHEHPDTRHVELVQTAPENFADYDNVFIGYPIWWYDMPQLMYSFFSKYDLSGKTIIPFNSHGGSGFSGSVAEIAELEPNATVRTDGLTLSRNVVADSEDRIVTWLETIGIKKSA